MAEVGMNLVLSPSILGFVIGTRAALAFGLGLLLADRIPEPRRRAIGLTLVAMGAASTIPAAISLFGHHAPSDANAEHVSTADV
jgi:drug/metabolite transporter (DMT)-like permease